ncbi:DUF3310 domain-containing protein [Agrobacterium tumefaciens]|uniref:DUF3310 domain-containing protein n=1 Tax=Agrobacterium tumefaciens TaxID=358 RepID=UPI001571EE76|nr:DUF3310 domain-containing protein [Agrobacterium tumefaciens]NSZ63460.1 DUF3310 domain-containing protein [Agrobacterium tumefaciens]NTA69830.1 DUF3310 domain-containing protein [Agrobacterium tumefaciens]WIE36976.1 DUF3310 domain-containing protein [Agrobacterium tumefaciens]
MSNPYERQEAGTHYVNMGMQPFHFAMVNGWDAGAFSILKYVSRHRSKNGLEDLKKARHFVDLRQAEIGNAIKPRKDDGRIYVGKYCTENRISGADATALVYLEDWVKYGIDDCRNALIETIELLMSEYSADVLL